MTAIYTLPKYHQHPIAVDLMPGGMDEEEFKALCDDCVDRGILFPATLYEGKVLDGWHRYRVAEKTGSHLKFIEYTGNDPAGYVTSVNVLRRRLSSLQRALVAARRHRKYGLSQREACKKLGISNEVLNMVLKAMDSKNSRIIKRIETESDYSRGMLREELAESGVLTIKPKPEAQQAQSQISGIPKSVFDLGRTTNSTDTDGSGDEGEDEGEHLPEVGKRISHPERRNKKTAAQLLAEDFKSLMHDEKITLLQMIWPEAKGLLKEAGLEAGFSTNVRELVPKDAGPLEDLIGAVKKDKPKAKKEKVAA